LGHTLGSPNSEVCDMKEMVLLVTVLTFVAFASGVMGQQTPATKPTASTIAPSPMAEVPPPAPEKAKVAKGERFIGKVSSVDLGSKTVVVKNPETEKTFTVVAWTKITGGGKEIPLADLKQGMNVSVSYKMEADKAITDAITVTLPRSADKATPKRTVIRSAETPAE